MFNGDINYFDWAIFNSKTLNYQRVLVIVCYSYDPMHVYDIEQSTNSPLISVIMSYHRMQLGI